MTYQSLRFVVLLVVISFLLMFAVVIKASAMTVKDAAQVEDYIVVVASNEGVNVAMALKIAKAESGFEPTAQNPSSTASGVFQFLNSTFKNYCIEKYHLTDTMADKNHAATQVNCAIYMLKEPKGYMHWWESSMSWKHLLS